jgi:putative membrane protein
MSARKPTAFSLDEVRYEAEDLYPTDLPSPEATAAAAVAPRRSRRAHWVAALVSALAGLAALALGLWLDSLVRALFERNDVLGWIGIALAALAAVALFALVAREVIALIRVRRITHVHEAAAVAAASDDREKALAVLPQVEALYRRRPETARGRAALAAHKREIIDGRDLIALAETELLIPFDDRARRMVMDAAKSVAVVTAIAPRALLDIVVVVGAVLKLIGGIARLYGGRPGVIGFLRLAKATFGHLAVTGGMAASDSLIQQIVGHGLAARLSARLGEGVINGLLTARVGIAAIEVCRPLPFINGHPPRIAEVMATLSPLGEKKG